MPSKTYISTMKSFALVSIALFTTLLSQAQPGWQQHVDTKISVRLDDKTHFLHGYEEMTYTNNSPDTLHYIYIHLWPNAYKNDHTPFAKQMDLNGNTSFYYAKPKDRGYIDSLQFTIDDQSVEYYSSANAPDIARIDLLTPLLPGQKAKITTPFRVKVPIVFSRMGHTGQAYFISQWFPKPAVYDRKGWHPISYLDQGEFFSDYGSYDVSITLPKNYVVMATGNCTDESEMKWLDEMAKKPLPSDTLYRHSSPVSDIEMKTLHYHEDNVHDFAWFADKRWIVRKDTVYSPGNNELVTAWAAFLPFHESKWVNATSYLKETVKHYGKWVGPYTYKTIKAVEGDMHAGGGMEYPTVTVIDRASSAALKTVVIHEAGHNWFYGMLGSNERDHAWMDEGINTFYEKKTNDDLIPSHKSQGKALNEDLIYYELARTDKDQAIDQTSANFEKLNYGIDVYYKTTLMLKWLESYIGEKDFNAGMQDYYITWRYKHPYPEDFKVCMQKHTSKQLDWFFDQIMSTDKKIDFTILHAHVKDNNTEVTIRNNSGVLSPALIDDYNDTIVSKVWTEPFTGTTTLSLPTTTWRKLSIDDIVPDSKTTNNEYRRYGLSHRFGLKVKPFLGLNRSDKEKLFIAPALGYNYYDGFMLGLLFHNLTVPENRFRYAIAPMYAFGSKTLTGSGSIGYIWYPRDVFKEIMLQGDVKSFDQYETHYNNIDLYASYLKIAPSLSFTFNEHDPLSTITRTLTLKEYNITENNINYGISPSLVQSQKTYGLLRYRHENERTYNPFNYSLEGQLGADFAKINVEGNLRIDYHAKNKALYVRGYFGKFFAINSDPAITERYELNATYTGINDYLYDGTYIGRNNANGLGAQQVSVQEGGFKVPTYGNIGRSDNWMAAVNLKSDLPFGKIPLRLFLDAGLIPNPLPDIQNASNAKVLYDAGLEVYLIKNTVSIYVPIIMSSDFQNYLRDTYGNKNRFTRGISFTLQLRNINWLKEPTKILKLTN